MTASTSPAGHGPSPRIDVGPAAPADDAGDGPALRIDSPGFSTLLRARGRPAGEPGTVPSGWADPVSALAAHRLVGNPPGAPLLENTGGSLRVTALGDLVVAVTGAEAPLSVECGGAGGLDGPGGSGGSGGAVRPAPARRPFALRRGERLVVGTVRRGLRVVLSVRGGLVPGSAEGEEGGVVCLPLSRGRVLAVGEEPRCAVATHEVPAPLPEPSGVTAVALPRKLRAADLAAEAGRSPEDQPLEARRSSEGLPLLAGRTWRVSEEGDHIGVLLTPEDDGAALPPGDLGESAAASSGLAAGAVQLLPGGEARLLLTDLPEAGRDAVPDGRDPVPDRRAVVLAHLDAATTRLLAQAAPGARIRFDAEA
jgi:allophanate hydrolase subunit 2